VDKTNWTQGQIPTPADMNALHGLTETALSLLIEAVTGGLQEVLLTNKPPLVSMVGANWQMIVQSQYAAVQGRFFEVTPTTLLSPVADKQIGLYFILRETDTTENRERLRLAGSSVVRETVPMVVRAVESGYVSKTESGDASTPPPAPVLGADDVGYVLFAKIKSLGGVATLTYNTAALWSFPGGGMSVGIHGSSHLPSGTDPIPLATVSGDPGLMPTGAMTVVKEALQDIIISPLSPYLLKSTTGTNTPTDPKICTLEVSHHASMEIKDVGGVKQLGVRFMSGPYDGGTEIAARRDHKHSLTDSPVTIEWAKVDVVSLSQMGTMIPLPTFSTVGDIASVEIFWCPPGSIVPIPGTSCGWFFDTALGQMVGVNYVSVASNEIWLEIGAALAKLQDSARNLITSRFTGGTVTWDSATGDGNTPRTGVLFVKVIGARS